MVKSEVLTSHKMAVIIIVTSIQLVRNHSQLYLIKQELFLSDSSTSPQNSNQTESCYFSNCSLS